MFLGGHIWLGLLDMITTSGNGRASQIDIAIKSALLATNANTGASARCWFITDVSAALEQRASERASERTSEQTTGGMCEGGLVLLWLVHNAAVSVSYTHLTLPTIYSV